MIILGDFGLVWNYKGEDKTEKYWLDWLDKKSFTTVFMHGDKVNYIRPSVIHLMRGQIFNIEDKTFFAFGGASSYDISAGILESDDSDFKEKKKRLDKDPFALYKNQSCELVGKRTP